MSQILFINGSPDRNGNTAALAKAVLNGREAEQVNLPDYNIHFYGSDLPGDQFDEILQKMKKADVILIGSPVYWHNICGAVRTLLDRFYGPVGQGELSGKKLGFLYQGAAPEKWMLEAGEYTMKRFCGLYGPEYEGVATNRKEAEELGRKIFG